MTVFPQKKKDQLTLAQDGDKLFLRIGPIPTAPGGWGLRNPELKGPGQRSDCLSQSRRAVAGRKLGRIMISANDLVTLHFLPGRGATDKPPRKAPLRRQAVGAIM